MNDDAGNIPSDLNPSPGVDPAPIEILPGISNRPVVSDNVPVADSRLYVPNQEDWGVEIKRDSDRIYCYAKQPGQDWFHLILNGEIYVTRQHERYCLSCALRMGFLTQDRLFWQHRVPKRPNRVL